ncbi:MAG: hypothetical protein Q7K44_02710 [Candidatus Liptonbacteria bacterium]|nr:hypothetical protein [Candidatus Liptonbacteria bacterium]
MEELRSEQPSWTAEATKKWQKMEWGERQHWLAKLADDLKIVDTPQYFHRMKLIMTYKHFGFEKVPDEYKKILAQKWGLVE